MRPSPISQKVISLWRQGTQAFWGVPGFQHDSNHGPRSARRKHHSFRRENL